MTNIKNSITQQPDTKRGQPEIPFPPAFTEEEAEILNAPEPIVQTELNFAIYL